MLRRACCALGIVICFAFAACGGGGGTTASDGATSASGSTSSSDSTSSSGGGGTTDVTVGLLPISAVAPIFIGIDRGFFKDEGLNVHTQFAKGGAALLPAVVQGSIQFGFSNPVSIMIASSKGLGLEIIGTGSVESKNPKETTSAVTVLKDSPIHSIEDLAGKTIAVNTLKNIAGLTVRRTLEKHGVDPDSVHFLEVALPDSESALKSHRVDAIWLTQPFTAQSIKSGDRVIMRSLYETRPGLTFSNYFVTTKYAQENPDTVAAFSRALQKSIQYSIDNPKAVRAIIPTYTKTPPEVAKTEPLPHFRATVDAKSIHLMGDLMKRYDFITKPPDYAQLLPNGQ